MIPPLLFSEMKHLLITTIAAVVLVGCGTTQQVTVQAPDISIQDAAKDGNIKAIKQHIAAGTDVNAKGRLKLGQVIILIVGEKGESTPLHWAAYGGHKEITELFIAKGADVNAESENGVTPLHMTVVYDHKEVAELLIANGADVNAKMDDGRTPLDWAINNGKIITATLLRKHGGKTGEELKAEGK